MTGGHLVPGNDLVGRPTKTVRTDNNNINININNNTGLLTEQEVKLAGYCFNRMVIAL